MAVINAKKLLPPSKSSATTDNQKFLVPISNIIPKSSAIVKAEYIKLNEEQPKQTRTSLLFEVIRIRKKVIKVEKVINNNLKLFQKTKERERKQLERQKFEKREKELEKKEPKNEKEISGPSLPKIGFLDRLKRFLLYTALGYAFTKFGKHIPKILEFTKKLTPAFKFVEELTGNILNGVVDFIGAGYKAYDQVRGIAKSIGGENFEKKFDEFSKQFNIFANLAIVAGLAATGGTDFGFGKSKGKPRINTKSPIAKSQYFNRDPQTKLIEKKYGNDAARMYEARKSQGVSVNRARADVLKRFKPLTERYGVQRGLAGGTGKGAIFSRGLGKAANRASLKVLGKAGTKIAKGIFGRVPIIGGLLDFAFALAMGEKPGRAAAKAVGATIGSALGTFIPIPFAGTILGGILGDIVGGALYDTFAGNQGTQAKAQGGSVTRGGKKVNRKTKRSIRKIRRRPPRIQPQKSIPGKDIGGKKEIEKLFPTSKDKSKKDPLGTLEKTSKNLKEIPMLGGLMGASIDLVMGQKPDRSVFRKIGYGFGALIQNAIDSQSSLTMENIQKQLIGLAGGGVVPKTLSSNENIGMKIGEQISRTFEVMINSKVNESLQAIRRQLNLEGISGPGGRTGGSTGGMYGGYAPTGIQKEIYDYLINEKKMNDIQALGLMANISRESSFVPNIREPGGTGIGLFQWSHGRVEPFIRAVPDWETNWKAQIDYALNEPQNLSLVPPGEYQRRSFSSAQEAADWWMREWERPADESSGSRKHAQYLSAVPKAPDGTAKFRDGTSLGTGSGNFDVVQYVTGDATYRGDGRQFYYDRAGHGMPSNYHDHIAFRTVEEKERAKAKLRAAGIEIGDEYRPGDPGYHGKNLAIDVPGSQWGGSGAIGEKEYQGSRRVREVLGLTPYEKGGKVHGLTKAILGEKGPEFVLDADTTAALEQNFPGFLSALNRAKYDDAISVLKNYTSYEGGNTSTIMLQRVIMEKPVPMPMGGGNASTSSIDSNMDSILQPLTVG